MDFITKVLQKEMTVLKELKLIMLRLATGTARGKKENKTEMTKE